MAHIFFISSSYPLDDVSTSGVFVARLVKQLSLHHQITVLTPADTINRPIIQKNNITIIPFRYAPRSLQILAHTPGGIPVAIKRNPLLYLLLPPFISGMLIYCLRYARHSDIFHANWAICGFISGLVGILTKKPVITTLRGDDITRSKTNVPDAIILYSCIRLCSRIVGVSSAIVSELQKKFPKFAQRISLIENGVDSRFLNINRISKSHKASTLRLITIGSLISRKGIDVILHALAHNSSSNHLKLSIVGDGVEKERLLSLSKFLNIDNQVCFYGTVASDKINRILAEHDVFVLASYSEGRPNVILEAMAIGLPIIASNIDGVNELVEPGITGLIFEPGNYEQLSACIDHLIKIENLQDNMGNAARLAIIKRGLLWENTAARYSTLYNDLVNEKS